MRFKRRGSIDSSLSYRQTDLSVDLWRIVYSMLALRVLSKLVGSRYNILLRSNPILNFSYRCGLL